MALTTTLLAASMAVAGAAGTQPPAVTVAAVFRPPAPTAQAATTYDSAVPAGSRVRVTVRPAHHGTRFELRLHGVKPRRTFGAHLHQSPCTADPQGSGGHYQHLGDPVQPSVDPAYANPRNEAWLDVTTDARGEGRSLATVAWHLRPARARSVVVHEHATDTRPGRAGTAGARLACVTVPFP
ncbi:superoxide dismutase family protein [Streptomyces sp. ISL-11]|uniref:superoxide dismutase family protein n=1 Tax=Streptomyces sp. ISL-11 TaxID=2819174 RepID=UPI001BE7E67D|nr:superoxide dismutase family protein [Streptomyces sp. ISL-11]MBT2386586.1 superoxide dismutase family protein [Streptomyces sp. ISL-11]